MRLYEILEEGLINSVPTDNALSIFKNKGFDASIRGNRIVLSIDEKERNKIDNILNAIGWYAAYESYEMPDDHIRRPVITIEPKYGKVSNNIPTILYHATESSNVDNIMKIGLVPKSKSRMSEHPDRIYAAISREISMSFATHFIYGLHFPAMLTIDTQKINNKWYEDPNLEGGLYTTTNISPVALKRLS